jgi:predicted hydrolase (HD superfamily)
MLLIERRRSLSGWWRLYIAIAFVALLLPAWIISRNWVAREWAEKHATWMIVSAYHPGDYENYDAATDEFIRTVPSFEDRIAHATNAANRAGSGEDGARLRKAIGAVS